MFEVTLWCKENYKKRIGNIIGQNWACRILIVGVKDEICLGAITRFRRK